MALIAACAKQVRRLNIDPSQTDLCVTVKQLPFGSFLEQKMFRFRRLPAAERVGVHLANRSGFLRPRKTGDNV